MRTKTIHYNGLDITIGCSGPLDSIVFYAENAQREKPNKKRAKLIEKLKEKQNE